MYHHTEGIWLCQKIFGRTITVGGKYPVPVEPNIIEITEPGLYPNFETVDYGPVRQIPVRLIAELHVEQDLGWIPSPKDYIDGMVLKPWMGGLVRREMSLDDILEKANKKEEEWVEDFTDCQFCNSGNWSPPHTHPLKKKENND